MKVYCLSYVRISIYSSKIQPVIRFAVIFNHANFTLWLADERWRPMYVRVSPRCVPSALARVASRVQSNWVERVVGYCRFFFPGVAWIFPPVNASPVHARNRFGSPSTIRARDDDRGFHGSVPRYVTTFPERESAYVRRIFGTDGTPFERTWVTKSH